MAERSVLDLTLRSKKTGSGGKDASRELKEFRGEADKAKQATKGLNLESLALGAAMAAGALAIGRQIGRWIDLGLESRRAEQALIGFTGSAEAANEALEAVGRGAEGSISRMAAAQNAARLFSMGLATTADEAEHLTRIAVTLGASMGKGPQQAFEDLTLLLANQSILRLDTFGISGAAVREKMADLASQGIAPVDRQTRFLIATMEEADAKLRLLEEAGFEVSTSWEILAVRISDLRVSLGEFIAETVIPFLDILFPTEQQVEETDAAMRAWMDGINADLGTWGELGNASRGAADDIGRLHRAIGEARVVQEEATEPTLAFANALGEVDRNVSGKISGFIEDLQFLAAGGLEIQQAFQDLQEGVQLGLIDEDEAERQAGFLFIKAQEIEASLGNITGEQAAQNIAETLGLSLEQAEGAVRNIKDGILRIPSQKEITILVQLAGPGAGLLAGSEEPTAGQTGLHFTVGGMPGPDRNLVTLALTRGEQVDVTPRAGSPQRGMAGGGSGGSTINFYNTIGSEIQGMALLEKMRDAVRGVV
jgi:hypothetical protein